MAKKASSKKVSPPPSQILNVTLSRVLSASFYRHPERLISMAITNSQLIEAAYNALAPDQVIGFLSERHNWLILVHKATPDANGQPEYLSHEVRMCGPMTPSDLIRIQRTAQINILNPAVYNAFYARSLTMRSAHEPRRRR